MADEESRNQILANMARADCDHDFGGEGCSPEDIGTAGTTIFNANLPVNSSSKLDENGTLELIRANFRSTYIDASEVNTPLTTTNGNVYGSVIKVNLETNGSPRPAAELIRDMQINESITLIVDFNQSGFLSRLRKGDPTSNVWYYAYVPETENDPAGKSPSTDPVFKNGGGVPLQYIYQTSTNTVTYPIKNINDGNLRPFFFRHRLMLDPVETITCFGKSKKKSVALTITSLDGQLNHQVLDSKKANSIQSIKTEFLKKVIQKFNFNNRDPPLSVKFNAACAWAQKRSGDWLQVLACLDLQNRLMSGGGNGLPVFFVTHDRIAMAYALFMGVNVIFIKGAQKEIIVFRNGAAANPLQQQQSCIDSFDKKRSLNYDKIIYFLEQFAKMRRLMLDEHKQNMIKEIKNKEHLFRFMKACLHYVHTYFDIPDTSLLIEDIQLHEDSCKKLTSFITAENLYVMHNGKTVKSDTFNSNFEFKEEFSSLYSWKKSTSGYISRFLATLNGNNNKDIFSFLGYIQKLSDTVTDKFNDQEVGVKLYIKQKIQILRETEGFREAPVAALIDNTCVIIQADDNNEPITTENFNEIINLDNGLSQQAVVSMNIYNDLDKDTTNQEPNNKDPLRGGRRRKTRRGGWDPSLAPWNYSKPNGSTVIFPIKQTTHLLLIAHLLADPPALCKMFGRCSIRSRPQFNDIRILDNDVQERGEVLTPRWLVSRFFQLGAPRAEELGPGGPVVAPGPAPEPAPEPELEPEADPEAEPEAEPEADPNPRHRRGSQLPATALPRMTAEQRMIAEGQNWVARQRGGAESADHVFPIYVSLEALEPNITKRLEGSLDMDLYRRYYTFLDKLAQRTNALTEQRDKEIIAFALREVLFISSQHVNGQKAVIELLGKDDIEFLSITNILSNYICGEIQQYTPEFEKIVDKLFKMPIVIDVVRGAYTDSGSFNPSMTIVELSNAVKKLRADLASQITQVDAVKPVPEEVPLKIPQRQIEDVGDPTAVGARRRRTRRLTKDFLQTTRHQSIKMSSRRHSLSGNALNR